ncbi:hypothetical protein [Vibrio vulnificus YJ016]|uniref:Uncharacterized protein n=1 Tax=Vibrio vulnificus (strain YJ016) TaxID=196600 RepID=Q7MG12_VIBVY|nr:hypothetical protein [Vibrio vulnificus YJ016]
MWCDAAFIKADQKMFVGRFHIATGELDVLAANLIGNIANA